MNTNGPPPARGCKIRRAHRRDAAEIARMSAAFRRELDEPTVGLTEEAVLRDGFGRRAEFDVFIAETDGLTGGYALFFESYEPTYSERGLYLADLYVKPECRRGQLGRALVASVAAESRRRKRSFVWWVTIATNSSARAFYERLGVVAVPVVAHAAFGDTMEALAASAPPVGR